MKNHMGIKNICRFLVKNTLLILLSIITVLSIYTFCISTSYFYKNEILWGISDKYVTSKKDSIFDIKDTILVNSIYGKTNIVYPVIKKQDSLPIINIKNSIPIQHQIIKSEREIFELGDIGDFIGGYFGFLIGIIGALLTFLAFYIQYKANRHVQNQFRLQQFEDQFYKMIDVYLNNKDKFSITGYKNPKAKVLNFKSYRKDNSDLESTFRSVLKQKNVYRPLLGTSYISDREEIRFIDYETKNHLLFQKLIVELKVVYRVFLESYKEVKLVKEAEINEDTHRKIFSLSYSVFYYGLNKFKKDSERLCDIKGIDEAWQKVEISKDIIDKALNLLSDIRTLNKLDGTKIIKNFYIDKDGDSKNLWLKLNYEPFKGYMHFLPQYYRNLFSIVKFVVSKNNLESLNETHKLEYLRILRSTISDYEQVMLFYNWYSGLGKDWEVIGGDSFFKQYLMIHNMKRVLMIDDELSIESILHIDGNGDNKLDRIFENY